MSSVSSDFGSLDLTSLEEGPTQHDVLDEYDKIIEKKAKCSLLTQYYTLVRDNAVCIYIMLIIGIQIYLVSFCCESIW